MKVFAGACDEQQAIEAAQTDPARFAELYDANFNRIYGYIARRTRNREEAQDLTAEVFQRALAGIASFKWQGKPFAAWLLGIAHHVLAQRSPDPAQEPELEELPGSDNSAERRVLLLQLLQALPEDQRQVLLLRFAEDKSAREIAHELGRSQGAVKQLQLRGLRKLREQLRS